jgi:hypothetical protein
MVEFGEGEGEEIRGDGCAAWGGRIEVCFAREDERL